MSCAAFDALSLFDSSSFKLIHLPKEVLFDVLYSSDRY